MVDSVDPCCLNPEGQITGRPWTQGDKGDGVIKGLLTQWGWIGRVVGVGWGGVCKWLISSLSSGE